MQNLWYRLTHTSTNLDDCLDLANTKPIEGAFLRLRYDQLIREQRLVTQLVAQFELKYPKENRTVEHLCGGYLDTYSEEKKRVEIGRANAKLKELTQKLEDRGIMLANSDQQFEYSPSAKPQPYTRKNPYEQFADTDLILRDQLAIDRTILANERTFLAYCRTCLAMILTGAGCIKLFESPFSYVAGWMLIVLGLVVVIVGIWHSRAMARNINTAGK